MPSTRSEIVKAHRVEASHWTFATGCSWMFAIYVAALPLMQLILKPSVPVIIVADAVFLIACTLFAAALIRRELSWRSGGFNYALGIYAGAILLSALLAPGVEKNIPYLLVELYVMAIAALTFNVVRSERALKVIFRAWLLSTALTVLAAISGIALFYGKLSPETNIFFAGYGSLPPGNYPRVRGLFLNMNMCCSYLSISLVLLLAARCVGWIGRRSAIILGCGIFVSALFTFSPGLGGLALGFGLWMWAYHRMRGRIATARSALLAGILIALAFNGATVISPASLYAPDGKLHLQYSNLQPSVRVLCWRDALHTAWQYKWLGKGPGSPVAATNFILPGDVEPTFYTDAHNTFLSVAAHEGIVGLAAFCGLVVFVLRKPHLLTRGNPQFVVHTAAWIGLVQALLYQGLSGSWEHTRHIWVLIGLTAALQSAIGEVGKSSLPMKHITAQNTGT
jgi:O-antigen ligase